MSVVAITVEGVLRKPIAGTPIDVGIQLYQSLTAAGGFEQPYSSFDVVLLTDERQNSQDLHNFITQQQLAYHVDIIWSDAVMDKMNKPSRRLAQLGYAKIHGNNVQLVVEPDPAVSSYLIANGKNVLTFTHAQYSQPSWRPDYVEEVRPWDSLSQQVADNARLRAEDERLNKLEARDR